jgi:cysteine-rich repeat protein
MKYIIGLLFAAILVFTTPAVATASTCGNNIVETGERCDDGNTTAGDGCDASCQPEGANQCLDSTRDCHYDPSKNVFETHDANCDGTDSSIIFCDGFEDTTYVFIEERSEPAPNDYWQAGVFWSNDQNFDPFRDDPKETNYTECNAGTVDEDEADFGAAGTPCTATSDWVDEDQYGRDAIHWITADSTNPDNPQSVGTWDYYVRFYFKESGASSTRCSAGYPNCADYSHGDGNGYKAAETSHIKETGGIEAPVFGSFDAYGRSIDVNNPDTYRDLFSIGIYAMQSGTTYFDHRDHRDEWIFVEYHVKEAATGGKIELWMDGCGRDGLGCSGTPTLRASFTGDTSNPTGGPATTGYKIRALWMNWWTTVHTGEIQFDEIVVRNGETTDLPIGFFMECRDADGDGVCNDDDNCLNIANADQSDGDADGYGEACDFDVNNDCATTSFDQSATSWHLGETEPPDNPYDTNLDGAVTSFDQSAITPHLGTSPGPSGKSCASCGGGEPTGAGASGACP